MNVNFNKYFFYMLKFLSVLSLITYFYGSYLIYNIIESEILSIILLILLYFFGYFFYLTLIHLYRLSDHLYPKNIRYTPFLPVIFYMLSIINFEDIHYSTFYTVQFIKIIGLFLGLFILNKYYTNFLYDTIIPFIIGKQIFNSITVSDYFTYISIFSKGQPEYGDHLELIKSIIVNLLGYKIVSCKAFKDKNGCHEIFRFTRTKYQNSRRTKDNILLLPMKCTDINYINWVNNSKVNENQPSTMKLTNFQSTIKHPSNINSNELRSNSTYQCYFILQYNESEDIIGYLQSINNETYLAFANILSKNDVFMNCDSKYDIFSNTENIKDKTKKLHIHLNKSIVTFHKDNDILVDDVWYQLDYLFSKFISGSYGTLIDKISNYYIEKVKPKLMNISVFIKRYTNENKTTIAYIASFFTILGAIIKLYDWFKGRNN